MFVLPGAVTRCQEDAVPRVPGQRLWDLLPVPSITQSIPGAEGVKLGRVYRSGDATAGLSLRLGEKR